MLVGAGGRRGTRPATMTAWSSLTGRPLRTQGSLLAYFFNSAGRHAALAVAALHDIGAERMEQVLTEAAAVVAADGAAWDKGRSDLDALPEWTVTQPYRGLPQADILGGSMTTRFWEAAQIDDGASSSTATCVGRSARSPLGASSASDPGRADHLSWPGSTRTPCTRRTLAPRIRSQRMRSGRRPLPCDSHPIPTAAGSAD